MYDITASMGGLLGFGLGFSAISAIEICFFMCCSRCFRKKRNTSKPIWTPQTKKYINKKNMHHQFRRMYITPLEVCWLLTLESACRPINFLFYIGWNRDKNYF